jgi:GTP-binding protein Era
MGRNLITAVHEAEGTNLTVAIERKGSSMVGVDVIVWLVEALQWTEEDTFVLKTLAEISTPVILCVNKIDKIPDKNTLLPYLQKMATQYDFREIVPISARKGHNLLELESKIIQLLPISIPLFPEEQITDRSERFLVAELIREKLIRRLGEELPYRLTVQIEHFSSEKNLTHISALIWVERQGQKMIVIGKKGNLLKAIGVEARLDMEALLECKVFLQLWVKVKQGWCDDERALQQLGYSEE